MAPLQAKVTDILIPWTTESLTLAPEQGPNPKTSGLNEISLHISEDTAARKKITSNQNSPGEVLQGIIEEAIQDSDVEV